MSQLRVWLSLLKHSVVYDRNLSAKVAAAKRSRSRAVALNRDLDFLKALHEIFPIKPSTMRYDDTSLLARARERFRYLDAAGIVLKGLDLLDLGAGHGENLWLLDELGLGSATGIDYTDDRFRSHLSQLSPETAGRVRFLSEDLTNWNPPERAFDLVLSINSFEHFQNPKGVLENCHRLLRPGGIFFAQFGPLFRSPFGPHRHGYSSVPYIQNLFDDEVAYDFFYDFLKINEGVSRYTGERIEGKNPYVEVNRWDIGRFRSLFLKDEKWEPIRFERKFTYRYSWFTKIFRTELGGLSHEDLYVTELSVVLRKR